MEGRQHSFQKLDEPGAIAEQLVSEQSAIIEQHLPFALDNYENMIRVVHILGKHPAISIQEIAERSSISRMRVKDALNDLRNAHVVLEKGGGFNIRDDLRDEAAASSESSRELVERLVASRKR